MSFLQSLTSFGQRTKDFISGGLQKVSQATKWARRGLGKANAFIDDVFEFANNYPLLAELAEGLKNNSYYQSYRDLSEELDDVLASGESIFDGIGEVLQPGNPHLANGMPNAGRIGPGVPGVRPTPIEGGPSRPLPPPPGGISIN